MPTNLDDSQRYYWTLEITVMGYVEMYKNGYMVRMEGGEFVMESKSFICDNCETQQPEFGSEIVAADRLQLIQFCSDCAHLTIEQKRNRVAYLKARK